MSRVGLLILPGAVEDLRLQSEWYSESAGEVIALRYLSAVEQTCARLTEFPESGSARKFKDPRLHGLRSISLPGAFRVHLVFYRIQSESIVIFRVMHGMRHLPQRLTQEPGTKP
jgi:toxin ParE1/3/4